MRLASMLYMSEKLNLPLGIHCEFVATELVGSCFVAETQEGVADRLSLYPTVCKSVFVFPLAI